MTDKKWIQRVNWWAAAAGGALMIPALVLWSIDLEVTQQNLITQLTRLLLAGMVVTGIGNVMRAVAHNRYKSVDGTGKVVGLAGWAVSLISVVTFAAERSGTHDGQTLGLFVLTSFLIGLIVTVVSLIIPWLKSEVVSRTQSE